MNRARLALLTLLAALSTAPDCTPCAANCQRAYDSCVREAVAAHKAGMTTAAEYAAVRLGCSTEGEACGAVCQGGETP